MTVEAAPETDCLLRCGRPPRSPRFQLRNHPGCNLPPREFVCTRVVHRQTCRTAGLVRGACAQAQARPPAPPNSESSGNVSLPIKRLDRLRHSHHPTVLAAVLGSHAAPATSLAPSLPTSCTMPPTTSHTPHPLEPCRGLRLPPTTSGLTSELLAVMQLRCGGSVVPQPSIFGLPFWELRAKTGQPALTSKCLQIRPNFPSFPPISRSKRPSTSLLGTDANPCTRVIHQIRP